MPHGLPSPPGIPNFKSLPPSPSMEVAAEVFSDLPDLESPAPLPLVRAMGVPPQVPPELPLDPPGAKILEALFVVAPQHDHLHTPHPGVTPSPAPLSNDEHVQLGKHASQTLAKARARDKENRQMSKILPLQLLDVQWA